MHIYEYLFTTIVIVTMLIAASTMISTVPQSSITISGREQLKTTTQKIMIQFILETGNPPDWGSNINISSSNLTAFGLAKFGETVRDAYVLDPDKVQRLCQDSPFYIQPSDVIRLLNLGKDYGIALGFTPALDVKVTQLGGDLYEVAVYSDQNGMPLVNAEVSAKTIYYDENIMQFKGTNLKTNATDPTGKCRISFDDVPQNSKKILVAVVDYYGIRFTKTYVPSGSSIKAYIIGNNLLLNKSQNITGSITQVTVLKSAGSNVIEYVSSSHTKIIGTTYNIYNISFVEPTAVVFLAISSAGNNLIVVWKDVPTRYSSIPEVTSLPFAYSLDRNVIISGSSYTMRLQVWRMAW